MESRRSEPLRRLFSIAETQQGFFTTKQAKTAGFAENTHSYHVQTGNWIRVHRGIYRLALFPPADRPDLVLWALWSKNRREETEGVYSHQTALRLHELSDVNPAKLHMTVPRRFRRNSEIPGILVLHYDELPQQDLQSGEGFQFTRPLRTILDLAGTNTIEKGFLRQTLHQALDRGLISRIQIRAVKLEGIAEANLRAIFRSVA